MSPQVDAVIGLDPQRVAHARGAGEVAEIGQVAALISTFASSAWGLLLSVKRPLPALPSKNRYFAMLASSGSVTVNSAEPAMKVALLPGLRFWTLTVGATFTGAATSKLFHVPQVMPS